MPTNVWRARQGQVYNLRLCCIACHEACCFPGLSFRHHHSVLVGEQMAEKLFKKFRSSRIRSSPSAACPGVAHRWGEQLSVALHFDLTLHHGFSSHPITGQYMASASLLQHSVICVKCCSWNPSNITLVFIHCWEVYEAICLELVTWYKVFSAKIRHYFHKYNFWYEFLSFAILSVPGNNGNNLISHKWH